MAAITTGLVVAGAGIYSANKQSNAAKDAAKIQAQGVQNAQEQTRLATEQALPLINQGFTQARDAVSSGANQAQQNLLSGNQSAIQSLGGGYDQAINTLGSGYDTAKNDLTSGYGVADQMISGAYGQAQSTLQPSSQQGAGASQLQAALSGSLGPEAQATAFQNYKDSPGQDFLAKQQEQSLLRNQAALGGGLSASPRVMAALQEQAFGRAQTDFDNQFNRLGSIANRGDAATQSIAQLQAGLGDSRSGIQQQLAQLLSGISTAKGTGMAGLQTSKGSGVAGLQTEGSTNLANLNTSTAAQLAQLLSGQGTTSANTLIGQGSEQAQLAQNLGQAQSGAAVYNSQNAPALLQGLQQGLGAYTALGGNFGGLLSGKTPPPTSPQLNPQYSGWNIGKTQY